MFTLFRALLPLLVVTLALQAEDRLRKYFLVPVEFGTALLALVEVLILLEESFDTPFWKTLELVIVVVIVDGVTVLAFCSSNVLVSWVPLPTEQCVVTLVLGLPKQQGKRICTGLE